MCFVGTDNGKYEGQIHRFFFTFSVSSLSVIKKKDWRGVDFFVGGEGDF